MSQNCSKISFQLSADTGKNKVRSFTIISINFVNLILTLFMCWCAISLFYWLNALLHKSQQYGPWPVHTLWVITWLCIINDLSHTSQQFRCSTVCMCWWITILHFWINVLLHTSQQYWHSPLCKRLCYEVTLISECLTAHITAIWALTTL
jgi:hypothetical protein